MQESLKGRGSKPIMHAMQNWSKTSSERHTAEKTIYFHKKMDRGYSFCT